MTPASAQTLAVLQSADNSKKVVITVQKVPEAERATALRDFQAGFKNSLVKDWQLGSEKQVTIRGLSFISLIAHKDTQTEITYTAAAGEDLYFLAFILNQKNATSDPEVESIMQSFQLLTPGSSPPGPTPAASASKPRPTPAVSASQPGPAPAVETSLPKPLLELESHIAWSAVDEQWKKLRPGWETATKACSDPKCVAKQLLDLEAHVKSETVEGEWKKRRAGWVSEGKSASTDAEVAKLLLELEENIGWQAVDEGWKVRRDGWVAEVKAVEK